MLNKKHLITIAITTLSVAIVTSFLLTKNDFLNEKNVGARTSNYFNNVGDSYLEFNKDGGYDLLLNGSNHYINFNTISGFSGYGFRDNAGSMEVKDSGGSWIDLSAGSMTELPFTQIYVGNASSTPTATSAITVLPNGNVGIGSTSPTYELTVDGEISVSGENPDIKFPISSGFIYPDPTITENVNGTVTVDASYIYLHSDDYFHSRIGRYFLATTTLSVATNTRAWVTGSYNGGTPIYEIETDASLISGSDRIPCFELIKDISGKIHEASLDSLGEGLANKNHRMLYLTQRFRLDENGGLTLGETATPVERTLTISAANAFFGSIETPMDAVNTSVAPMYFYYHVGGVYDVSTTTQYNNTQYDDGTDLVAIGANQYSVVWIYRGIEEEAHAYMLLDITDYPNISAAQLAQPRSDVPEIIKIHTTLVGRIIIQEGASSGIVEQILGEISFIPSTVQNHNDLANIQGGSPASYYHLSLSPYTELTEWIDNVTLASNGYTTVPDLTVTATTTFNGLEILFPATCGDGELFQYNDNGQLTCVSAGVGDVTSVGNCTGGACLDGTSDGGSWIKLYDGDSNYTMLEPASSTSDLSISLPDESGDLATINSMPRYINLTISTSTIDVSGNFVVEAASSTLQLLLPACTIEAMDCKTNTGTLGMQIGDGTASSTYKLFNTTASSQTLSSNNSFTNNEGTLIEVQPSAANTVGFCRLKLTTD